MQRMLPFFIFMHLHLASHLGTLDVPRVDMKHGMLESKITRHDPDGGSMGLC